MTTDSSAPDPTGEPVLLAPNRPQDRPYRGGAGIERFRGMPVDLGQGAQWRPEDFVASTTEVYSGDGVGLTVLEDGTLLRDAVVADPVGYLGREHVAAWGADPRLLVKLLDTRERLFVHYHPDGDFARRFLAHASGKTEAWIIVDTDGPAYAYLGFSRAVSMEEVLRWHDEQDVDGMLAAMNRVSLKPGDTLFVPAGMPHSIGEGITLVELQQPVDLSILLERDGFPIDETAALLGLDAETAFAGLDRAAVSPQRLAGLASRRPALPASAGTASAGTAPAGTAGADVTALFPAEADTVFRADRVDVHGQLTLEPAYGVLVVLSGDGRLAWRERSQPLTAGSTVLVPFGAGETVLNGSLTVLRCRPPAP